MHTTVFTPSGGRAAELPRQLFGFEVIDRFGKGAGSTIYVVSHPDTRQLLALKHVQRKSDPKGRYLRQLKNEYQIARQFPAGELRRALTLRVHRTLWRTISEAALVMEMFDGQPLSVRRPHDLEGLLDCFIQAARGLESLHGLGYVHCDLKPDNLLLDVYGKVKVIDFGQSCRIGTIKPRIQGSADYMAPEQARRRPVGVYTDIFNLGATLYHILCGRPLPTLFTLRKSENAMLLDAHLASPRAIDQRIPETLSDLVMQCVRSRPAHRPQSMVEVAYQLAAIRRTLHPPLPHPATSAA